MIVKIVENQTIDILMYMSSYDFSCSFVNDIKMFGLEFFIELANHWNNEVKLVDMNIEVKNE